MRPIRRRSLRTRTAWARALLFAPAALTSGCTTINETLVQPLWWTWAIVSGLLAGLIVCVLRWLAWYGALTEWEHPAAPKPGTKWWQKEWTPLFLVGAVLVWFAVYSFSLNPLPSSPEQQWRNAGAGLRTSTEGVEQAIQRFAESNEQAIRELKDVAGVPQRMGWWRRIWRRGRNGNPSATSGRGAA